MQIVNLTDKPVTIAGSRGQKVRTYLPSTVPATCNVEERRVDEVDGVPLVTKVYGKVHGLPSPEEQMDVMYIVSELVARAVGDSRFDLLLPNSPHIKEGETLYRSLELV